MILIHSLHLAGLKGMVLYFQLCGVYGCLHSAHHSAWHGKHSINIYCLKKIMFNGSFCLKCSIEKLFKLEEKTSLTARHSIITDFRNCSTWHGSLTRYPHQDQVTLSLTAGCQWLTSSLSGSWPWSKEATLPQIMALPWQQPESNDGWCGGTKTWPPCFRTILTHTFLWYGLKADCSRIKVHIPLCSSDFSLP